MRRPPPGSDPLENTAGSRRLRQLRKGGFELRVAAGRERQPERNLDVRPHAAPLESLTFDPYVRHRQHQQAAIPQQEAAARQQRPAVRVPTTRTP
jgi:hypothetical protein